MRALLLSAIFASLLAACGGDGDDRAPAAASAREPSCPARVLRGWQRIANRVQAPVFCPAWLPDPFSGEIGESWNNIHAVRRDRSYVVGFTWYEVQSGELHVNLHGFPGRTTLPKLCVDDARRRVACFSEPRGRKRLGRFDVTFYTRGRGLDTWHLAYTWRHAGSLYAVSQHVAKPLTYRQVVRDLERIVRNLVVVRPERA